MAVQVAIHTAWEAGQLESYYLHHAVPILRTSKSMGNTLEN